MSQKLYWQDSYAQEFSAQVLNVQNAGGNTEIILDKTLFYPNLGGQAHDTGVLTKDGVAAEVASVRQEKDAGNIVHVLQDTQHFIAGDTVSGKINWSRRLDHMQQHTGEHMLGQAFFRLGLNVVAVNMEHAICTLDLDSDVTTDIANKAEQNVNAAIYAAHKIETYEVDDTQLLLLPLRRAPKVSGLVRVVQIGDYDYSACGGTHLNNSSQVGIVKILRFERSKGGSTRVYFICGGRCLEDYRFKHNFVADLGLRFSTATENVPTRTNAIIEELTSTKTLLSNTRSQLAAALLQPWLSSNTFVLQQVQDSALALELAKEISAHTAAVGVFVAKEQGRIFVAVGCAKDSAKNANEILKLALPCIDGKGGGKPELAQGSGTNQAGLEEMLRLLKAQ